MRIVFPEVLTNEIAGRAAAEFPEIKFLPAESLDSGAEMVARGAADSMISGLDFSSRDVLISYKNQIALSSRAFSSSFILEREDAHYMIADGGVNKLPDAEKFYCIVEDSAQTFFNYYGEQPRIAILSYSTYGSGGKNPDLLKFEYAMSEICLKHPEWIIDGEMQLDAAVSPEVAAKKTPGSSVAGRANILITPDLNSGNILYKAMERFGGFTVAGPLIQGFEKPLADLSRGSSFEDTVLTIRVIKKLLERNS